MASGEQAQCLQFAMAVAAVDLSGASGIQAVCMPVCEGGRASEAHRGPGSLFSAVFTLGCVWLHFLAGGAAAGEQPRGIAQVALWSFGTGALRPCKLSDRWKPQLVAQVPS